MRRELLHILSEMSDIGIERLLKVCTKDEIEKMFLLLEYTDQATIDRWSGIYARMYN